MLSKIEFTLGVAIILSAAFPASAATKHHRVTHDHRAIYNRIVPAALGGGGGCTASGGPECSGACTGPGPCAPPDVP